MVVEQNRHRTPKLRNEADKSRPVHVRPPGKTTCVKVNNNTPSDKLLVPDFEAALGYLLDPVTGSAANSRKVLGVLCLHVDDLLFAGSSEMHKQVIDRLRKECKVGSEDKDDVMFTGQRIRWRENSLVVDQDKGVEELKEIELDKNMKDDTPSTPELHTEFRSLLGSINWPQSRTQFLTGYRFSSCASASASPTIKHDPCSACQVAFLAN